jgi:hypothetical protein
MGSLVVAFAFGLAAVLGLTYSAPTPVAAEEKAETQKPDPAAVQRARDEVKKLDDLYKTAVVGITATYVEKQVDTPAATVAKALFEAMHKKGYHSAKLLDASGKPKSKKNVASTDFEKKVVSQIQGGKSYVEEIGETDGKPVLRAGTIVPAVMKQCVLCHGGKEGELLGVLVYEVPIK